MLKSKLPIKGMSWDDFEKFRGEHFNKSGVLSIEAIKRIDNLFGINRGGGEGGISCDEQHTHNYRCYAYSNPIAGVVDRLLIEREHYRQLLKKISHKAELD